MEETEIQTLIKSIKKVEFTTKDGKVVKHKGRVVVILSLEFNMEVLSMTRAIWYSVTESEVV